jgi:hypothetical protein
MRTNVCKLGCMIYHLQRSVLEQIRTKNKKIENISTVRKHIGLWTNINQKTIFGNVSSVLECVVVQCHLHINPFTTASANLWLMNDNTLAWAIEGDDFSSMDFWGSLLGQLCTTSNWKIIMGGLSLCVRSNFCQKNRWPCSVF